MYVKTKQIENHVSLHFQGEWLTKTIGLGRRTGAFEIVFLVDAVEGDPSAVAVDELQLRDCEHFSAEDDCPDDKSYRCANRVFFYHFLKMLMSWSTSGELSIISFCSLAGVHIPTFAL